MPKYSETKRLDFSQVHIEQVFLADRQLAY